MAWRRQEQPPDNNGKHIKYLGHYFTTCSHLIFIITRASANAVTTPTESKCAYLYSTSSIPYIYHNKTKPIIISQP